MMYKLIASSSTKNSLPVKRKASDESKIPSQEAPLTRFDSSLEGNKQLEHQRFLDFFDFTAYKIEDSNSAQEPFLATPVLTEVIDTPANPDTSRTKVWKGWISTSDLQVLTIKSYCEAIAEAKNIETMLSKNNTFFFKEMHKFLNQPF